MCVSGLNNWSGKPVARLKPGPRGSNPLITASLFGSAGHLMSPPRSKRAVLRDVSVRLAPLPPVWRDGRVRFMALALHPTNVDLFVGARPESESTFGRRGFKSTLSPPVMCM